MTLKMKTIALVQSEEVPANPTPLLALSPAHVDPVYAAAAQSAVAAVAEDNARLLAKFQEEAAADRESEGAEAIEFAEPSLHQPVPVQLFEVDLNGVLTHLVLMISDSNWNTAYRLAVVTPEKVELSPWERYSSPIIVGPWIFFSEYFDSYPRIGHAVWSENAEPELATLAD